MIIRKKERKKCRIVEKSLLFTAWDPLTPESCSHGMEVWHIPGDE